MFAFNCSVTRRRDARPPVLLTAALAVAVPGFLVTACSGQTAVSASPQEITASAPASTGATGSPNAPPQEARRPASALAAHLLTQAAQAAVLTSYQGEEIISHWGTANGGSVLVSDIWHASGGQTITQTLTAGTAASSEPYLSSDTDGQWPEGVLGVTTQLVRLLETHYVVVYAGAGSADNRTAQIVEAWRENGSLAARFWLDDATKLP
ncbi:MAG TPA: hypothetical protein VJ370_10740, partial [Streptosporangiaceae bacterium]|nr:hypothetical protein [Streptosporangiaceae bacterium]